MNIGILGGLPRAAYEVLGNGFLTDIISETSDVNLVCNLKKSLPPNCIFNFVEENHVKWLYFSEDFEIDFRDGDLKRVDFFEILRNFCRVY
jgi:hypothetical protein